MITVTRTGPSARDVGAELRARVSVHLPLATAKALTFTAQRGQKEVQAQMRKVFAGGATPYTLGGTRIVPATESSLVARVAVKDKADRSGTLPEDYLFPQVAGGPRKEKRFERAMRYAGVLQGRERAVPGQGAPVDRYGNLARGDVRRILKGARSAKGEEPYFAARIRGTRGVWERTGAGRIKPVLILVAQAPVYRRPRLDFEGAVRRVAERDFPAILARLLRADAPQAGQG